MNALLNEKARLWSLYMSLDQGPAADCVMYAYHNICDRIAELDRK
jgi:hypothetical protein